MNTLGTFLMNQKHILRKSKMDFNTNSKKILIINDNHCIIIIIIMTDRQNEQQYGERYLNDQRRRRYQNSNIDRPLHRSRSQEARNEKTEKGNVNVML